METKMKAIDTYYNGNYFRSKLEARWAVCFDALKVEYEYEPKKFRLRDGSIYMPDFYFPKYDFYAEVKPFVKWEDRWALFEAQFVLMFGQPNFKPMLAFINENDQLEVAMVIPFADLLNPAYGTFWKCTGNEDWGRQVYPPNLFSAAVWKAQTYRFEGRFDRWRLV